MNIKEKLHDVPSSPGIYVMKGAKDKALYVGKALNLKNRLKSYFHNSSSLDARKSKMVKEIKDFDYVLTKNELEALVLESNFIKKLKPKYNIILRDDKNYPYLKLTVHEKWPRLEVARRIVKDGSLYYGPYVPAGIMWETLKFIRRNFPLRTCRYNLEKPMRPCVLHQMGRCLAPCAESLQTKSDHNRYMEIVNEVKLFIQGERKELLAHVQRTMQKFSDEMRFEEAAQFRDRLKAIEKVWETQRVISPELGDMDVIGLYRKQDEASLFMLFLRNGMVIGQKGFFLKKLSGMEDKELISNFIGQFYAKEMVVPPNIILPLQGTFKPQRQWLTKKRGAPVRLSCAKDKKENEVLKMALDNARHSFVSHKETRTDEELLTLKKLLHLKKLPVRIDAIDVSNITGTEAVGALVAWEHGSFVKDDYRLFKIKTVAGIDDFAMIGEVVGRYFKDISQEKNALPHLILIDGGRGQLGSALNALKPFELPVEIAAIAKAKERLPDRVYMPDKKRPVLLEPFSATTHLLQRIRDEVHRVAIRYHKKLRAKRVLESPLEKIKGIGKTRRLLLLRHFGSIDAIKKASAEEIASIKGMNKKTAVHVKTSLGTK
ncbi:MAG: excinuclease ABC subunit UvrC [Thermodesulfovibrionia bacterium]|nr:excinuclease ABC subunit UvrC [Thermodesulfovibrionia bacterium]